MKVAIIGSGFVGIAVGKGLISLGNEIQLTDAIKMLIEKEDVYAYAFRGKRYDAGDKLGYVKAIIDSALESEDLSEEIVRYLKQVTER